WGGRGWTFWQYDDCGTVPGISGCVDLDRYHGSDLTRVTYVRDFGLSVAVPEASVKQAASTTYTIAISRDNWFVPITPSVTGLPAGATARFKSNPTSLASTLLTVTASSLASATPTGVYQL